MALARRHIKLKELALAAGFLEGCEIIPAVSNIDDELEFRGLIERNSAAFLQTYVEDPGMSAS